MDDVYRTISGETSASVKVKRSEFLAIAFPAVSEEAFRDRLAAIEKEHHSARHHCWAYRLFDTEVPLERSSDAGEPSGSAGRPILQAIIDAGLHDAGTVVVRWFGGIKLGTGGLGRAYRDAARAALELVRIQHVYLYVRFVLEVPFASMSDVYRLIEPPDIVLVDERFGETNRFDIDVRKSRVERLSVDLREKRIDFSIA